MQRDRFKRRRAEQREEQVGQAQGIKLLAKQNAQRNAGATHGNVEDILSLKVAGLERHNTGVLWDGGLGNAKRLCVTSRAEEALVLQATPSGR